LKKNCLTVSTDRDREQGAVTSPANFGPYSVVRPLGEGDFASVFLVSNEEQGSYALKWSAASKDAEARLGNEIEVLRALDHKGVPSYHDEGEHDNRPYFVMGQAPGDTVQAVLAARAQAGGAHGQLETLQLLRGLLEALVHVHNKGWVHRDIKAANVLCIASMTAVTLIDFGFAKEVGTSETRVDDSFWRAGAARYSPPAKLMHPGLAVTSHDVFAVGVLAYQLLTGADPWNVGIGHDVGELRDLMASQLPQSVSDRNSMVTVKVSRLVMRLIALEDAQRPSATLALQEVNDLLDGFAQREPAAEAGHSTIFFPRVVRDPLYGDIRLTDYERTILDTPEMQRLRYIKQLGLTNLVYTGAEHTRLAHAIGCVFRTEQMLRSIEDTTGARIEPDTRLIARIYALVHDVTHVAFGHTIEDELCIFARHDVNAARIGRLVLGPGSALGEVLRQNPEGRVALSHFDSEASVQDRSAITDLISGSTGADVLDYIDRDAFHCGLDHRIDSAIFRQLRLQRAGGAEEERLVSLLYGSEGVRIDREYAVESLLAERYALFLKIYCHKRKNAASALLDKALSSALWRGKSSPELLEPKYEWLSDGVVIDRLVRSSRKSVRTPAQRLARRQLPPGVYRAQLLDERYRTNRSYEDRQHELEKQGLFDPPGRLALAANLGKAAKVAADDVLIYCPPKAPGYQRVRHWLSREPGNEEKADDVDSVFREIRTRHLGLWEIWVFCASGSVSDGESLAGAAQEMFGFTNQIDINPRSDRLF
jgi:HD superfamily phosphohydrolase